MLLIQARSMRLWNSGVSNASRLATEATSKIRNNARRLTSSLRTRCNSHWIDPLKLVSKVSAPGGPGTVGVAGASGEGARPRQRRQGRRLRPCWQRMMDVGRVKVDRVGHGARLSGKESVRKREVAWLDEAKTTRSAWRPTTSESGKADLRAAL